jgi:hypothetical protein
MPRPQRAYSSRCSSTMTSRFQAPPSWRTQASVAALVQCEMAMKWIEVWRLARERSCRKSFSLTLRGG